MKSFIELITSVQIENILRRVQRTLEYYEGRQMGTNRPEDSSEFPMTADENDDPIPNTLIEGESNG